MCGIVGIAKLNGARAEVDDIKLMASTLVHRGPDEAGFATLNKARISFGHLRLSIIDLVSGQQPLFSEDGSICLVYNGEIYDYKNLRRQLEGQGHSFRTNSDSEVLLHLYQEYGLDFFDFLNGEFAFAIWDQKQQRLLLARDRMGVKPLFYRRVNDEILFASEAKAILAVPRVERRLSNQYLTGPLLGVIPADNCPFEGVSSLPPGHMLIVQDDKPGEPVPYWTMKFDLNDSMSRTEAEQGVLQLLRQAVRRRMVADVDVGVYLSGGLDSTVVAALMAEQDRGVQAFNIGFGDSVYDESDLSRRIAQELGLRFSTLNCSMEAMSEHYFETIYHTELALVNPSAIAKQMLSRFVRQQGVKVCQTGEGADEVFGGYPYFKLESLWLLLASSSPADRKRARRLMTQFEKLDYRSRGLLWDNDIPWKSSPWNLGYPSYHQMRARYSRKYLPLVFNRDALGLGANDQPDAIFAKNFVRDEVKLLHPFNVTRTISFAQMSGYVIPTLGDRVEMANSVECRTPFLDRDLLNFAAKIPPEYFLDIDRLREKSLLRNAVDGLLPACVRNEHKHPFFSNNWLAFNKTPRGLEIVEDLMGDAGLKRTQIFNKQFLKPVEAVWKIAPQSSKFFKRADSFFGFLLGAQSLHRQFIENRPQGSSRFEMVNRTWRAGAEATRSRTDLGRIRDRGIPVTDIGNLSKTTQTTIPFEASLEST